MKSFTAANQSFVVESDPPELAQGVGRHGAISYAHATRLVGAVGVRAAVDSGRWVELWPGVLAVEHRARDPLTRASGALLRGGPYSVLSGRTAAAMHGCTAAGTSVISMTTPYDRQVRSVPGLSVRQAWIRESDVVELDGLRVYALDVALTELLCTGPQRTALACVEQALGRLTRPHARHLRALVDERLARRRDRRGTRQAAALLELASADPPPATPCLD